MLVKEEGVGCGRSDVNIDDEISERLPEDDRQSLRSSTDTRWNGDSLDSLGLLLVDFNIIQGNLVLCRHEKVKIVTESEWES